MPTDGEANQERLERYLEEQSTIQEAVASRHKNIDLILQSKLDEEKDIALQRKLSYKMTKIFKKDQSIFAELSGSDNDNIPKRISQKKYHKNPTYNHKIEDDQDPTPSVSFPRRILLSIANAFKFSSDEDEFSLKNLQFHVDYHSRRLSLTISRAFKKDDGEGLGRRLPQKFSKTFKSDDDRRFRTLKKKKKEKISLYHDLLRPEEVKTKKRWFNS